MIIIILFLNIFLIIYSILISVYMINSFFTEAPFVPVKNRVVSQIINTLKLKPGSVLYDLGCGDAKVLIEAIKKEKNIKAIGVEKNSVVYLWSKWRTRNTLITIYCNDIGNISLKNATHIYMYLYPKLMDKFLKKIKDECSLGTRIVSCTFIFSGLVPDEVIDLPVAKDGMCKKLYVYVLK